WAGLFVFFLCLLFPSGLHHGLNGGFLVEVAGGTDLANVQSKKGKEGITGRFMAGFFPIMMFGVPAGALALYQTADAKNKKHVASLMLAGAISAFVVGITEPIDFAVMFVAPQLYLIHAYLTGFSLFFDAPFPWAAGFYFFAGPFVFFFFFFYPFAPQPLNFFLLPTPPPP
ncbi:PTS transporter subunit EIIC, partial [Staphylococcus hyicus]